jgi:hypothetical protein
MDFPDEGLRPLIDLATRDGLLQSIQDEWIFFRDLRKSIHFHKV